MLCGMLSYFHFASEPINLLPLQQNSRKMKNTDIKRGDKVRFLNDVGGGVVTRVDGKTIYVEDEIGFEVPMPVSEVVIVGKNDENKIEKSVEKEGTSTTSEPIPKDGSFKSVDEDAGDNDFEEEDLIDESLDDTNPRVYLAFLDNGKEDDSPLLALNLVNDSNFHVHYLIVEMGDDGLARFMFQGLVQPNTKEFLDQLRATDLDVNWRVQLILSRKDKPFQLFEPVSEFVKVKANKFFRDNSFQNNDFFEEKAVLLPLIKSELERKVEDLSEKDTRKILQEKGEFSSVQPKDQPKKQPKKKQSDIIEVDLHIHELLDDTRGLSNADMLKVQMDHFHKIMEENLKNIGQKLVFIHGIGNGTLKHELRRQLNTRYKKHNFQDASFREYGFGATMVII